MAQHRSTEFCDQEITWLAGRDSDNIPVRHKQHHYIYLKYG